MGNAGQIWVSQSMRTGLLLEGNETGVLLIHGFTGTPKEMQRLGEYLHERGLTVHAPLLPGHGGTLAQINRVRWQEWGAAVEEAYAALQTRCAQVFVGGFSMGALLALWLAAHHTDMPGLVLYAPPLKIASRWLWLAPVLRHVFQSFPKSKGAASDLLDPEAEAYLGGFEQRPVPAIAELYHMQKAVVQLVPQVRAPALVVYALNDHSIHPESGPETAVQLSKVVPEVETLVLEDVGHALVVDEGWEQVAAATYRFIEKVRAKR